MKFFKLILGTWLLGLLVACGGGGGSPGENPNQPILVTTAGSEVTVLPGSASAYGITGGVPPYRVQNSDVAIAVAGVNGSTLTIGGVIPGSSTVAVLDNSGLSVPIKVNVGASTPLETTAPGALSVGIGSAAAQDFRIFGGVAPYFATSSNAGVVSTAVTGGNLRLTGLTAGTAVVTLRDSANATRTIAVTVASVTPLYTTAQSAITVAPGANATRNYLVGGGTAPYVVSSSNQGVATVSLSGTTLSITGQTTGTATVTLRDAANATVNVAVTVAPSVALFSTAPSAVTVAVGASTVYQVGGGVAPYSAASSNTGAATATLSGGSLTIAGVAAGSASVSVRDAVGGNVTIDVTVPAQSGGGTAPVALFATVPSPLTLAKGATSPSYTIGGGVGPYTALSSNSTVVSVVQADTTFTLKGESVGATSIVITDFSGTTVSVSVVVPASTVEVEPLKFLPSSASGSVGDVLLFSLFGGANDSTDPESISKTYTLKINDPSVAKFNVNGTLSDTLDLSSNGEVKDFKLSLLKLGLAIITVIDGQANSADLSILVDNTSPFLRLSPRSLSINEVAADRPITFFAYGGTGPYTVFSDDISLILPPGGTISGPAFQITQKAFDLAAFRLVTLTIVDSQGGSDSVLITIFPNSP